MESDAPHPTKPPLRCLIVADREGRVPGTLLQGLNARGAMVVIASSLPAAMVQQALNPARIIILIDPLKPPLTNRQLEFVQAVRAQHDKTTVWGFEQANGHAVLQPLNTTLGPDGQLCRWRSLIVHTQQPDPPVSGPLVSQSELAMLLDTSPNWQQDIPTQPPTTNHIIQ